MSVMKDDHWASLTSSAVAAVVVGFASTILIIMQAAEAVQATDAQKISWAAMLCFTMGGVSLLLSWRHRMPIIIAWSTPGAALLATGAAGVSYTAALGAFAFSGLLMVATGLLRPLARAIERMPAAIASAMLAGVLLSYVLKVPTSAVVAPQLVVPLIMAFFAMRLWKPMWTIPVVVGLGLLLALFSGAMVVDPQDLGLARLTFDWPVFSPAAVISLGLPLYLVTMASQNLPGFAVLRACGYAPPVSSCLVVTGAASVLMAPFAGPQVNMAAITAALATGADAHPDAAHRWKVSIPYFVLYGIVGVAAGLCVKVLGALPHDLIVAIAGLALFGPLMGAIAAMMKEPKDVEAALVTFLVTASGFSLFGIGAAFWGLVAGLVLWGVKHLRTVA